MILVYVAIAGGIMLYLTKLVSFYAILSSFPRVKNYLKASPFRLAMVDLLFGFMGMHVISIAAGSVSAMFIMIVFGTCSIVYLSIMSAGIKLKQRKARLAGAV